MAKIAEKVNTATFTDCHCHILAGLDDGPSETQESLEMARILASFGFSDVFCTPHLIKGAYENSHEKIRIAVTGMQAALDREGITLTAHTCVEYYLDEHLLDSLDHPLPVADNIVLMEAHQHIQPRFLAETAYQVIIRKKLRPLIAHPERYDVFDAVLTKRNFPPSLSGFLPLMGKSLRTSKHHDRNALDAGDGALNTLREMGCMFQGNIGSFAGIYGKQVRKRALRFLEMGIYDRIGSDAHHERNLEIWLKKGMNAIEHAVGKEGLSRLLSPLAIREGNIHEVRS